MDFGLGDSTPGASPVWSSPSKSDEDDGKYALGLDRADAAVGAAGGKLVLEFSNVDFAVEPSARILSVFADSGVDVTPILLRSVHGTASPGGVLGILGKSGAGKSLLLDLLAGRAAAAGSIVSGSISVNSVPVAGSLTQQVRTKPSWPRSWANFSR